MSSFLAYLRNDKGGAVEYVLVTAAVGGLVFAVGSNKDVKDSVLGLFSKVFTKASDRMGK